jgi:hypothetical protein
MSMWLRAYGVLLVLLSACATTEVRPKGRVEEDMRRANLQRAAGLPWADEGRCVVREAGNEWPVLAERCFHALDHERVQFHDPTGRCAVAAVGAAAVGGAALCILAAPEIVVGAVVVIGVVVVGVAIAEALEAYERRGRVEPEAGRTRPSSQGQPTTREPVASRRPKPEPAGQDWPPPLPPEPPEASEPRERSECTPRRVPPKGGHPLHNRCADNIPGNAFRGANVLIDGKAFDGLQPLTRMLWEVKTTAIETYNPFVRDRELKKQVDEARHEHRLAAQCGYDFTIGVRTEAHKMLLESADDTLKVVVMDWC